MLSVKSCCEVESTKPDRLRRVVLFLVLVALGAGLSLHLRGQQVSHWWLPFVLLLLTHGMIISGITFLIARRHKARHGTSATPAECCRGHEHGDRSEVIRSPRYYDWLVRVLALGGERRFRRRTLDLANLQPGESVLDVGCGTGTLLIEAAKRVGAAGAAHGIEPSAEMVAHARRKASARGVTVNVQEGSADRLPYSDAAFDVVFSTLVLHHLPSPMQAEAIGEMRRVLRPGGRLVIVDMEDPKTVSAAVALITLFHKIRSHATAPDWQTVTRLLNEHGFQSVTRHAMLGGAVSAIVGRKT